jgi:hypothetical protein
VDSKRTPVLEQSFVALSFRLTKLLQGQSPSTLRRIAVWSPNLARVTWPLGTSDNRRSAPRSVP